MEPCKHENDKCILFDDIGPTPPSEYGSYNEMDEHTNMC